MEFKNSFLNLQQYELSNIQENIELVIYSILSFSIPLIIGHPQFVIGTIVNAALILGALNMKSYRLLPIIMLPSLGVLAAGLIFGKFTMLLVFMIPFIWVANAILALGYKYLNLSKKLNSFTALGISAAVKTAFLFGFAFLFVSLGVFPAIFLTTMGLFQLYTAITGGVIAIGIQAIKTKLYFRN